jgi:hypothetical protein
MPDEDEFGPIPGECPACGALGSSCLCLCCGLLCNGCQCDIEGDWEGGLWCMTHDRIAG